ncbi:MAG: undecaprenyldiphospho-muramoylpentapeptide beta-N-acetylglucosaminyltransferase [Deltaproteobacteria bacterium]|nr:undecaprenyldiphospho-muramoylpentapeptide beta-N-acetylglucosaminyltransferase [Deltaproteobacteria bacterium]
MNVVIATTGTGGELFPGIAVAQALKGHNLLFVVSGLGSEEETLKRYQFSYERIAVGRLKGQNMIAGVRTLIGLPKTLWSAQHILRKFGAQVVFGLGGYSAGPVVLASYFLKIPRAILEPNAVPGLTNRLLWRFSNQIYTAFPGMERYFPGRETLWTGLPVRGEIERIGEKKEGGFSLLVFGGSRGAQSINRLMFEAVPILLQSNPSIKILHQTGQNHFESAEKKYRELGLLGNQLRVVPFIQDMGEAYREADLVVSRAGASTIAELIVAGRPAIFIPYPHAARNHQEENARALERVGGAKVFREGELAVEGGKRLAQEIVTLASDPSRLSAMKKSILNMPGRGAAEKIATSLINLGRTGGLRSGARPPATGEDGWAEP